MDECKEIDEYWWRPNWSGRAQRRGWAGIGKWMQAFHCVEMKQLRFHSTHPIILVNAVSYRNVAHGGVWHELVICSTCSLNTSHSNSSTQDWILLLSRHNMSTSNTPLFRRSSYWWAVFRLASVFEYGTQNNVRGTNSCVSAAFLQHLAPLWQLRGQGSFTILDTIEAGRGAQLMTLK